MDLFSAVDIYAFNIGCHLLGASIAGIRYSFGYLRRRTVDVLVNQVLKWCAVLLKSFALLSIWVSSWQFWYSNPVLVASGINMFLYADFRHPCIDRPAVWAVSDSSTTGACGWEPRFPSVSRLGIGASISEDMDKIGNYFIICCLYLHSRKLLAKVYT